MRRHKQALSTEENLGIINRGTSGVLALCGKDNQPYTVPLNYVYFNNKIYFHCALTGHKLDLIKENQLASFCIIDQDNIVPQEFTSYYRSVNIQGIIQIISDEVAKRTILQAFVQKYSAKFPIEGANEINKFIKHTCILELTINNLTGKEALELIKQKKV